MKHAPMLLIGVLSLATACGTAPRTVAIDAQTQQQLTADVEAVKAAQQDRKTAEDALTTLTSHVAAAQAAGHLNATQAQGILAAAWADYGKSSPPSDDAAFLSGWMAARAAALAKANMPNGFD